MPGTFIDEAIVLRRVNYAEADRILTVITREHGKLGVISRGSRKAGSKLAAHTDLFSRSRMEFTKGRGELLVLTQAQQVRGIETDDPRRAATAAVIAELTDKVLENAHPDAALFELICTTIDAAMNKNLDPRAALVWFTRQLLDRLGYAPQLQRCAQCETELPEAEAVFSPASGGLLCARCAPSDPSGVICSVRVIKMLRVCEGRDASLWFRLKFDVESLDDLEFVAEREIEFHLDRRLKSWDVLRALERPR